MRSLANITVAKDGNSAVLGGGVFGDEVIKTLDAKGKVTGLVILPTKVTLVRLIDPSDRNLHMCRSCGACFGWWVWPIHGLLRTGHGPNHQP